MGESWLEEGRWREIKLKSGVVTEPNLDLFTRTDQSAVNLLRPVVVKEKVQHLLYGGRSGVQGSCSKKTQIP